MSIVSNFQPKNLPAPALETTYQTTKFPGPELSQPFYHVNWILA